MRSFSVKRMICRLRISLTRPIILHWTVLPVLWKNDCLRSLLLKKTKERWLVNWTVTENNILFLFLGTERPMKNYMSNKQKFFRKYKIWCDISLCIVLLLLLLFFFCLSKSSILGWFYSFWYLNLSLQCRLFAFSLLPVLSCARLKKWCRLSAFLNVVLNCK